MGNFDTTSSLAIIALAALIHASFQVSVSTLTLMSGHALGKKTAHGRLLRLVGGFIGGVAVLTLLILSAAAFLFSQLFPYGTPMIIWAMLCGATIGVAIAVWLYYYREQKGTSLWIPRNMADHLNDRSKATKNPAEAFSLGLASVLGELLFIFAPLLISALVLVRLSPALQLAGVGLYVGISLLPLLIFGALIGGGHTLARLQKWRESNKRFLQFAAGSALFALGMYVYVEKVIVNGIVALGLE
jgi:hypothetical protein